MSHDRPISHERLRQIEASVCQALARAGLPLPICQAPGGPVPLTMLLEVLGIEVIQVPDLTRRRAREILGPLIPEESSTREEESLGGLMAAGGGITRVLVRANDILTRRRFTLAHELGHHLLHKPARPEGILRFDLLAGEGGDMTPEGMRLIEAEAHAFAAELLMPGQAVRAWHACPGTCQLSHGLAASRLASLLLVSLQAASRRLHDLELAAHQPGEVT